MTDTTAINAIPFPEGTDDPDISAEVAAAAAALDNVMVPRFASASERDAVITSPVEGQLAWLTQEGVMTAYSASASWYFLGRQRLVNKQVTESTSSTTHQDDDELRVYMEANGVYHIYLFGIASSTSATRGQVVSWTVPDGATGLRVDIGPSNTAGAGGTSNRQSVVKWNTSITGDYGHDTAGSDALAVAYEEHLIITNGSTPGYAQVRWSQHSGAAGTAKMRQDSYIRYRRVA